MNKGISPIDPSSSMKKDLGFSESGGMNLLVSSFALQNKLNKMEKQEGSKDYHEEVKEQLEDLKKLPSYIQQYYRESGSQLKDEMQLRQSLKESIKGKDLEYLKLE